MKNNFIEKFRSKIILKATGKNIERFLRRLISNKIELIKIKRTKYNQIYITIYKEDYDKVMDLKTVYEIETIDTLGMMKIKKLLSYHKIIIFFLILSILFVYFLTHIIFEIEIVHTDKEVRRLVKNELETYGIKEKSLKKSYQEIQKIKEKILENNKDKIEWLEIENVGIKYIVRIEEREKKEKKLEKEKRNIVAKKSGIIKRIEVTEGDIQKEVNNYVNKGDLLVSGIIYLNENIMDIVSSTGHIYAEVWYKVKVSLPLYYYEKKDLHHQKTVYTIHFIQKRFEFNLHPFKQKEIESKKLLYHTFLPISLEKEHQKEIEIIDKNYNKKEAIEKARRAAKEKIEEKLKEGEYIISQKDLKIDEKNSKIELEEFISVYEDIASYEKIEGDILAQRNNT